MLEEDIFKLEKDSIYKLMKENLTIERLEHLLETGKYLRNSCKFIKPHLKIINS